MGNLLEESVDQIFRGRRRAELISYMNSRAWDASVAQPTSRTARLDRIARAIMHGELGDAEIEAIVQSLCRVMHYCSIEL